MNIENKVKTISLENKRELKKNNDKINLEWLIKKNQIQYINRLFLNEELNNPEQYLEKEINKKIKSYLQQDKHKNIYENTSTITYEEVLVKLIESKLCCYYCKKDIYVIYDKKLQQNQWTLDRTNNYDGHSDKNTVICCLHCNIKKGRTNTKKFLFTKELTIKKTD